MLHRFILFLLIIYSLPVHAEGFFGKLKKFDTKSIHEKIDKNLMPQLNSVLGDDQGNSPDVGIDANRDENEILFDTNKTLAPVEGIDSIQKISNEDAFNSLDADKYQRSDVFHAFSSAFFTEQQRINIDDARHFTGEIYANYIQELEEQRQKEALRRALELENTVDVEVVRERPVPPFQERFIFLQGIMFSSPDKWTIWVNNVEIKPDSLPRYIADISVNENYAQFKWYDAYTNKIIPIKLKPMERFHIDSRVFIRGG